jgi:hypothetical protein
MFNILRLGFVAGIVALNFVPLAFGQSYSKGDGTGNSLPLMYGPDGSKPTYPMTYEEFAARMGGNAKIVAPHHKGRHHRH